LTALDVLQEVLRAGGRVVGEKEHLQLLVPPALKPLAVSHREAIRKLLVYRDVLRRAYGIIAADGQADSAEVAAALQEQARLLDEIGLHAATQVGRRAAEDWYRERGACPYCGARGTFHRHEPDL
jgi:hypothetical protein